MDNESIFEDLLTIVSVVTGSTPMQIVVGVVSFVAELYSAQQTKGMLDGVANDVATLKDMVANLREVIREESVLNDIYAQEGNIQLAATLYRAEKWEDAYKAASLAATQLMPENVQVAGVMYFLTAAGICLDSLRKLAAGDPTNYAAAYKEFAKTFRGHALQMIDRVKASVAPRIEIRHELADIFVPIQYWDYYIDGVARYQVGWYASEAGHQFLEEKRTQEIDTLAAPIVVPLKIAAESWRTVFEGGSPSYGPLLEGCIVISKPPPEQPWALIVGW